MITQFLLKSVSRWKVFLAGLRGDIRFVSSKTRLKESIDAAYSEEERIHLTKVAVALEIRRLETMRIIPGKVRRLQHLGGPFLILFFLMGLSFWVMAFASGLFHSLF